MRVAQKEIKNVTAIMGGYTYMLNKVEIITQFNKVVMSGITYTNGNTPANIYIGQVEITTNKVRKASSMAVTKTLTGIIKIIIRNNSAERNIRLKAGKT